MKSCEKKTYKRNIIHSDKEKYCARCNSSEVKTILYWKEDQRFPDFEYLYFCITCSYVERIDAIHDVRHMQENHMQGENFTWSNMPNLRMSSN